MIKFSNKDNNHIYQSINGTPIDWISVTSLVYHFKPDFDAVTQSTKASKNPRSKWYGMSPEEIRAVWSSESARSLNMGTWYHNKEEAIIRSGDTYNSLKVIEPVIIDGDKVSSSQQLIEGHVYPEHLVYLVTDGICGQIDRVDVSNLRINIRDYKTSKTIKTEGFVNWEGISARMKEPLSHLDDCNFVHYSLQLSIYMYMLLKHNPFLSPGHITIDHIIFEQESTDKFGYPVYTRDKNNNFIVKEIKPYSVKYLKEEVIAMLYYLKHNRSLIKSNGKDNNTIGLL